MELYKAIKKRKAAKRRQETDALSTTTMVAGQCGAFPITFTIYNGGPASADKYDEALVCYLCVDVRQPFLSGVIYCGGGNRMTTLSSTLDLHSAPLAIVQGTDVRQERTITIPPPRDGQENRSVVMKQSGGSLLNDRFEVEVGKQGIEVFEWRQRRRSSKRADGTVCELMRLGSADEIVAIFDEPDYKALKEGRVGQFTFQNSGTSGELGEVWALTAVASGLYLCWRSLILRRAAGAVLGAVAKVALFGAAMGAGDVIRAA